MREEGLRGVRKGRFVPRTTDCARQRRRSERKRPSGYWSRLNG